MLLYTAIASTNIRGVFRTQSNIYDEAFLQKWLTAKKKIYFQTKTQVFVGFQRVFRFLSENIIFHFII